MPEDIDTYDLTVSGLQQYIDPLRQTIVGGIIDVQAWMDVQEMDELSEGTYEMPVVFGLSENIAVVNPVMVQVDISKAEEE